MKVLRTTAILAAGLLAPANAQTPAGSPAFQSLTVQGAATIGGELTGPTTATGSTTQRALAARAGEVVNILDYGAKCDGVTDDQPAILAAINAAASGNVRTVYSPPSKTACMVGSQIVLPAAGNITLFAYPGTQSWKATATNSSTPQLINGATNQASNILIYGLDLDGNVQGQFAAGGAQKATILNSFYRSDNVVFDHVNIHDSASSSIQFSNRITRSGIRNSTVSNIGMHFQKTNLLADVQQGITFLSNNAIFTGSITGSVLTVSAVLLASGGVDTGSLVFFAGATPGTRIVSRGTGTGQAGTYNLNVSYGSPVASTTMSSNDADLNSGNFAEDNVFFAHGGGPVNVYANSGFSAQRNKCFLGTDAVFTAAMNGVNLPVSAVASGYLRIGQLIYGLGVPDGARIVNYVVGSTSGSVGTYTTNVPAGTSVASRTMYTTGFAGRELPSLQSVFSNVGQPCVLADGVKGLVLAGNIWYAASEGAFAVGALEDFTISGNVTRWNRSYGIALTTGVAYGYTNGSRNGSISGNTLMNSGTRYTGTGGSAGILFLTGGAPATTPGPIINTVITGNTIVSDDSAPTGGYGIAVADFGGGLATMADVKISDDNLILAAPQGTLLNLTFSVSGCSVTAPVGSQRAGTFTAGLTGTCTPTITIGGINPQTAQNGYRCAANNMTTGAPIPQTATTATTCTLSGPTTSGDKVSFSAIAY